MLKIVKFTDVCMTGGMGVFSTYIFSADISPEMLKLGRITKVKVLFLVLVFVFNFDLFKFSAAILKKGLFKNKMFYGHAMFIDNNSQKEARY